MASNAVNGCPSIRVIIQQCLSAKLQVQPPTEDSDAQWVEVRNEINSGGPIIQTLKEEGGMALAPWAQFGLKIGWDPHAPQQAPPPLSVDVPQTKRNLSTGFMLLNPLPTKDENIPPVWGHSVTQTIYISPQTNEIAKSEVVRVALNKWTPVVEKGCQLLGVIWLW